MFLLLPLKVALSSQLGPEQAARDTAQLREKAQQIFHDDDFVRADDADYASLRVSR